MIISITKKRFFVHFSTLLNFQANMGISEGGGAVCMSLAKNSLDIELKKYLKTYIA